MLHGRLLKATFSERRLSQICAIEIGGNKENVVKQRCTHIGTAKIGSRKISAVEIVPTQI
jgi:hypothetical protein